MIVCKGQDALTQMRTGGKILSDAHKLLADNIKEGITTLRLDSLAAKYIGDSGAKPSFLGMYGFPNSACISIDNEVIHGIPSADRRLEEGMIVSIDLGVFYGGYHTDAARSYIVGKGTEEKTKLVEATERSFFEAVRDIKAGSFSGSIGEAVERYVKAFGYGIVRQYCGHGVGERLHEDPNIPNYKCGRGELLNAGACLAIEPMINLGSGRVYVGSDNWTVLTEDGKPSAHYENTVAVTETGVEILTL